MKTLLPFIVILLLPACLFAQKDTTSTENNKLTISFTVHPSSGHGVGFGFGSGYSKGNIGGFFLGTTDFKGKNNHPNIETGVGADIAQALRTTDEVKSWTSVSVGLMFRPATSVWFMTGIGWSFYQDFTQHANEYWVYRDINDSVNFTLGLIAPMGESATFHVITGSSPKSIGVGFGYQFTK